MSEICITQLINCETVNFPPVVCDSTYLPIHDQSTVHRLAECEHSNPSLVSFKFYQHGDTMDGGEESGLIVNVA